MSIPNTYVMIDPSQPDRLHLGDLLKQLEPACQLMDFQKVSDFKEALKSDLELSKRLKGVFVKSPDHIGEVFQLVQDLRSIKSPTFLVVGTAVGQLQDVQLYLQNGVSEILIWPCNLMTVTMKVESALMNQKRSEEEGRLSLGKFAFRSWTSPIMGNAHAITLVGWLNSNSELPMPESDQTLSQVLIDCEGLKGVNSSGIRSWLVWMQQLAEKTNQVILKNIHPFFLGHIRIVKGLVPENGKVDSFYLVYFNEELNMEKEFKFTVGLDFDPENMSLPMAIKIQDGGKSVVFNLDQEVSDLLNFYKGKVIVSCEVTTR